MAAGSLSDTNTALAAAGERQAIISSVEGSVLIQAAGKATALPAKQGMELKPGDRITTGKNGRAEITFGDGSVSRVAPSSRVDLAQLSRDASGGEATVINANWGKVWNKVQDVNQQNSRFEVNTPSAVAGVRGTGFAVEVGMDQANHIETMVRVYDGFVGVQGQGSGGGSGGDQTLLSPFQQALVAPQAPPPQPAPLDLMSVDNWEKDNLVEDLPVAYIEVETLVKDAIAEQLLTQIQEQRVELILLAAELEQLIKLQQEAEDAKKAELERLVEQTRKEMELRRDGLRAVEHERQKLAEERQQLQQVREAIQAAPPNLSPRELQQQLKAEARNAREAERANEQQRQERQSLIQEKQQQAQQARDEAQRQAEAAAVKAQLEQARQQVPQSLLQEARQAQSLQQFQQILGATFGPVVNEIINAPSTDTRVPEPVATTTTTTTPTNTQQSGGSGGGSSGGDDSWSGDDGGYTPQYYTVTVEANPSSGGTVAVIGGGSYLTAGSQFTVSAIANEGYSFVNWTYKGTVNEASNNASFGDTMPSSNLKLVANFIEDTALSIAPVIAFERFLTDTWFKLELINDMFKEDATDEDIKLNITLEGPYDNLVVENIYTDVQSGNREIRISGDYNGEGIPAIAFKINPEVLVSGRLVSGSAFLLPDCLLEEPELTIEQGDNDQLFVTSGEHFWIELEDDIVIVILDEDLYNIIPYENLHISEDKIIIDLFSQTLESSIYHIFIFNQEKTFIYHGLFVKPTST